MSTINGSVLISKYMFQKLGSIPSVQALGPNKIWENEAPPEIPNPVVTFQRIGAGHGIAPLGGRIIAGNYRYQWRIAQDGRTKVGIIDAAKDISNALQSDQVTTTEGDHMVIAAVDTDLPTIPADDSGQQISELGGEIEIFISWNVAP